VTSRAGALGEELLDALHDLRDSLLLLEDAAASCSGGRWVMSSLARGFLRSRLPLLASSSATGTVHARSFSSALISTRPGTP